MENSKWYDHWLNPIANYNEPWPPAGFKPHIVGWRRKLVWWVRNPLHNFFFYWVGVKGRVTLFEGEFLTAGVRLGWTHTKRLRLPVLSYRGKRVECYIGWRRHGGFGIALRVANSKNAPDVR